MVIRSRPAGQTMPSTQMAVIYLIRHGQAAFGAREYDRLSPIGERQARIVGHHMRRCLPQLDGLCSGGMVRQDRTAEIAREAMGEGAAAVTHRPRFRRIRSRRPVQGLSAVLPRQS